MNNNVYVIHSQSERGFWNSEQGWVYCITSATQFEEAYVKSEIYFPITGGSDAEWIVYRYDE